MVYSVPAISAELQNISPEDREEVLDAPQQVFSNYADLINNWIHSRVQYAITGKVEQNENEPLGVYLVNVKSAQPQYYVDEDVVVWGNIKARTLDDPVNIKMGCFAEEDGNKIEADKVDPDKRFSVFTLEEQDFACSFDSGKFGEGSQTITTYADFNFETLAFVKTYFMDRERMRAMTREGQDPFEEFNIKDRNPTPVYTNGPAKIEMGTTSPLVGVSDNYLAFPSLSVGISNRQGWQGKITALKELILLLPKGVRIPDPQNDCTEDFEEYTRETCETESCQEFVHEECISVCQGYEESSQQRRSCQQACEDRKNQCVEECRFLFEEEGQQYNGYALDIESIKPNIREPEDWEKYSFFRCRISPNPGGVLENTPITTKSFRVKARYNYTVEEDVSVRVEKVPGLDDSSSRGSGVPTISGNLDTKKRIIQIASEGGFENPSLILGIAHVESSFNHCYAGSGSCGTDNPSNVNCNTAGSCGLMQINRKENAHSDLFQRGTIRLNTFGCEDGQTAYDLECNIKSGIGILRQNYNIYGNNDELYNRAVDNNCIASNNPSLNAKYKSYTNPWDRALRAYNGFGCTAGADTEYVEKVNDAAESYEGGGITDESVKPPTNLIVFIRDGRVLVDWELSADDGGGEDDVESYNVYRKGEGEDNFEKLGSVSRGVGRYADLAADTNSFYIYQVESVDENGNKAKSAPEEFSPNSVAT